MNEVVEIKVLEQYNIWIKFNDNSEAVIDFEPFLGKGFTAELLNPENFKRVEIDSGGGVCWYNGYDFCPNFLKEIATAKKQTA